MITSIDKNNTLAGEYCFRPHLSSADCSIIYYSSDKSVITETPARLCYYIGNRGIGSAIGAEPVLSNG